jgi:hypothetical protein
MPCRLCIYYKFASKNFEKYVKEIKHNYFHICTIFSKSGAEKFNLEKVYIDFKMDHNVNRPTTCYMKKKLFNFYIYGLFQPFKGYYLFDLRFYSESTLMNFTNRCTLQTVPFTFFEYQKGEN